MTEYLTEQEQIQQLKNWIKQYGVTILAGIALALAISTGWHYWQNYRNNILTHASSVYDEMLGLRAQGNTNASLVQAKKLIKNYSRTPYASMAALLMSRDAVLKKDYAEAKTQLTWVIDHSKDKALPDIARLRLARILIAEKKADEALSQLAKVSNKNFAGLTDEIRGDALLSKGDKTGARVAYGRALQELPNGEIARPILQMKYDNLGSQALAV